MKNYGWRENKMVKCNTCPAIGVWSGTTLLVDGKIHRCRKGSKSKGKPFMWHGMEWEYIEDGCEPDPNIHRQVRMEGNTWTLYINGIQYKVIPRDRK